ncbi:MAG: FISUMP domain-containing protein [Bacteroidota bacterium]
MKTTKWTTSSVHHQFPLSLLFCLCLLTVVWSCNKDDEQPTQSENTFTDSRDGQVYEWVILADGKKWMAENCNFSVPGSWCYDNKDSNCRSHGRLYNWEAAFSACPSGWHLPTDEEWASMAKTYGGHSQDSDDSGQSAYAALAEGGESGLNCLFSGYRHRDGEFLSMGRFYAYYWTSTEYDELSAWSYALFDTRDQLLRIVSRKEQGFACRCVED